MPLIYSPATVVGTSGSDYILSIPDYPTSNLSGGDGNDLIVGDYNYFEAIRSAENRNTLQTALNLETNGLLWTTAGSGLYYGPASHPYGTIYVEGQAGATRWVSFTATAGASISFDIDFAFGSGFGSDSDLVVDLFDSNGNLLLSVDDVSELDPGSYSLKDPRHVGFLAGYSGTYYIQFREYDGVFEGDEAFLAFIAVSGHYNTGSMPIGNDVLNGDDGNDEIYGGEGNDTINGGLGADRLFGEYGDDSINGGDGNDHIQGHFGEDTIDGGGGDDEIGGGGENDMVFGGDGNDYVEAHGGHDSVDGQAGNDRLLGADGDDTLVGGTGFDRLFGEAGNDLLQGGADWDLIEGGAGTDTIQGEAGRDVLFAESQGNVQGAYSSGSDSFDGGTENDLIFAGRESDTAAGGAGDDIIVGDTTFVAAGSRSVSLNGGSLAFPLDDPSIWSTEYSRMIANSTTVPHTTHYVETYPGEPRVFFLSLVAGQTITVDIDASFQASSQSSVDTIMGLLDSSNSYVVTNDDNSSLDPGSASTRESFFTYVVQTSGIYRIAVFELGGDNFFEGDESFLLHVSVTGHAASAVITGDADNLSGNEGNDDIFGGLGNDNISGGDGNDFLAGGSGNDGIDGGDGNDTLSGGDGNDTIVGGVGDDSISGGNGFDNLSDSSGTNTVHGNAGADTLTSNGLGAWYGDEDNDRIIAGGTGTQLLDGGGGVDTLDLTGLGGADVSVDLGAGTASFAGGGVFGFENLTGGTGNETLTGDSFANLIRGQNGHDTIAGAGGDDRIEAGEGNDSADGGANNDVIFGGAGDDILAGSAGDDIVHGEDGYDTLSGGADNDYISDSFGGAAMDGGAGNDTLVLGDRPYFLDDGIQVGTGGSGADLFRLFSASNGSERDRITDFNAAEGDRISFWAVLNGRTQGSYWPLNAFLVFAGPWAPASFVFGEAFPAGAMSGIVQVFTYQSGGNTFLIADSDADLVFDAQDLVVQLDGLLTLTAGDFQAGTFAQLGTGAGDSLTGTPDVDSIYGLGGDDIINGLDSADWIEGGDGNDTVDAGAGEDWVTGGIGNDILDGGADDDEVFGGDGNDILHGGSGDDALFGDTGANLLDGGPGADILFGGSGNDTFYVDDPGDVAFDWPGSGDFDLVRSSVSFTLGDQIERLTLTGTVGTNGTGNSLANVITGNSGANRLDGGSGADKLIGKAGDDSYVVDHASDQIVEDAGAGTDTVESSVTHVLAANVENLVLTGTGAIDGTGNFSSNALTGNGASNVLNGMAGVDTMTGGGGNDTYYVDHAGDQAVETGDGDGTDLVRSKVSFTLGAFVENLTLTGGLAVDGTGNELANVINGNTGANTLDGGTGADKLNGKAGNDTYVVDDAGDQVSEDSATGGTDLVQSSVTFTLGLHLDNLTLTGANAINGTGNAAANVIAGNSAANDLRGLGGNDVLSGGDGDDELRGGLGSDDLTGGSGIDDFIFDTALGATNVDDVLDFVVGTDRIVLENAVFTGLATGALSASAFRLGTAAADADDRIIYDAATGRLWFDEDGNGAAAKVLFADLVNAPAGLSANDFTVI